MVQWHQFLISIFLICLLEFVFWFYCTLLAAGAAEEMYMVKNIETFKGEGDHKRDEAVRLSSAQEAASLERTFDNHFNEADVHQHKLGLFANTSINGHNTVGRFSVWIAVAVGLLSFKWLFPHFVQKAQELLAHPFELYQMLKFKFVYKVWCLNSPDSSEVDIFSYQKLPEVSRSFAAVIAELPEELRRPIANFCLVLCGLDTVEDDMSIPLEKKVPKLRNFYKHLYEKGWKVSGYGDNKDERDLLEQFHFVIDVFLNLKPAYQKVIADVTHRMGEGMAKYACEKTVVMLDNYNEYCHYVAGLVSIGLSQMFAASGLESKKLGHVDELANSMGLFLQKTNVTRDYLKDVTAVSPRIFYPKDIWGKYAKSIRDLKEPKNKETALQCLNEMVTNAMTHINDSLDYMTLLSHPNIFKFCCILQAMAIATLARIYNNYDVFKKVVKIRKGEAVQIMMYSGDYETIISYFVKYIKEMEDKIPAEDPNAEKMTHFIAVARERIAKGRGRQQ